MVYDYLLTHFINSILLLSLFYKPEIKQLAQFHTVIT